MNKIEQLVKEMCPGGVEMVPLWSVSIWDKRFQGVAAEMQPKTIRYKYLLSNELDKIVDDNGDIRILYTTKQVSYTTAEKAGDNISEGEIIAIPWGGNPSVKYFKGRFVTADNRIMTSFDTKVLSNKYIYYWMNSRLEELSGYYRGAGIKHPSMLSVLNMKIPLPPLPIQEAIVEFLDKFEALHKIA